MSQVSLAVPEREPAIRGEATLDVHRRLEGSEEMFFHVDAICPMNAAIHARISGTLSERELEAGLSALQQRHPLLRARIAEIDGKPYFEPTQRTIPLRAVDASENELGAIAAAECDQVFATREGPLLRCVWLRHAPNEATLLLVFHHAIGDGRAGAFALRDLLRDIDARRRGEIHRWQGYAAIEAFEKRFPAFARGARGFVLYLICMLRFMAWSIIRRPRPISIGARPSAPVSAEPRRMITVLDVLTPTTTRRLVDRARAEQSSVTAAIQAAFALALRGDSARELRVPTMFATGVCVRSGLEPKVTDEFGCFASGLAWIDDVGGRTASFWELARRLKSSLQEALAASMQWLLVPRLNRLDAWMGRRYGRSGAPAYAKFLKKMHPPAVMVSNIGRVDLDAAGEIAVQHVGVMVNQSVLGKVAVTAATWNDRLSLDFVASEPEVTRDELERIAQETIGWLTAEHPALPPAPR